MMKIKQLINKNLRKVQKVLKFLFNLLILMNFVAIMFIMFFMILAIKYQKIITNSINKIKIWILEMIFQNI